MELGVKEGLVEGNQGHQDCQHMEVPGELVVLEEQGLLDKAQDSQELLERPHMEPLAALEVLCG